MSSTPERIDIKRLAAEASAQHGIRIDPDDPVMAVATVNRLILEQVVDQVVDKIEDATRELERAAEKVHVRIGAAAAQELRESARAITAEFTGTIEQLHGAVTPDSRRESGRRASDAGRWIALGLALSILLVALGVWLDSAVRGGSIPGR